MFINTITDIDIKNNVNIIYDIITDFGTYIFFLFSLSSSSSCI